jgi:hypothetical protein
MDKTFAAVMVVTIIAVATVVIVILGSKAV